MNDGLGGSRDGHVTVAGSRMRGFAGVLLAVVGCAAPGVRSGGTGSGPGTGPGCLAGSSDPMLRVPDAWEAAAEAAMVEAVRARVGTRIRSGERVAPCAGCGEAVTIEQTRAILKGVTVVGWWLDPGGAGRTPGTVWAVACLAGREAEARRVLPGAFSGHDGPGWLRRPKRGCALGLSGPTLAPEDAVVAARKDAHRRLAMAIEAEVDAVVVEMSGKNHPRGTWDFPGVRPTDAAIEAVRRSARDAEAWLDERGSGPLGTPGLAYALACRD